MRLGGEFSFERGIPGADICRMGGGSGGGGSSGAVSYPPYMMMSHLNTLGGGTTVTISEVVNQKYNNSPFKYHVTYDPTVPITRMQTQNDVYLSFVNNMVEYSYWPTLLAMSAAGIDDYVYDNASADNAALEYGNQVDSDVTYSALPRFRRGMQTINAVCSSAFVAGQALIEAEAIRNKCKFKSDLYLQNYRERTTAIPAGVEAMLKMIVMKSDSFMKVDTTLMEECRQTLVARVDQSERAIKYAEMNSRWDLDLYTYWGNMLASIGSASVKTGTESGGGSGAMSGIMSGLGAVMSIVAACCW